MKPLVRLSVASLAILALASPALSQSIGGGGGASGGGGSIGGSSGGSSIGGGVSGASGAGISGSGSASPSLGGAANSIGSAGGAVGNSSTSTQERATEGSTTLNPVNADAVARTGNIGAATTIGGSTSGVGGGSSTGGFQSIAGTGPASLYNIPQARVNVDLEGIRSALRRGPSATPDANGN